MRILRRAVLTALPLIPATGFAWAQVEWVEYRPSIGVFRIEMPGKPKVTTSEIQTRAGPGRSFTAALDVGGHSAFIANLDVLGVVPRIPPGRVLEMARDSMASQGKLRSDVQQTVSDKPSRHFVVDLPNKTVAVYTFVMTADRMIYASANVPLGAENSPTVQRFHKSLSLIP